MLRTLRYVANYANLYPGIGGATTLSMPRGVRIRPAQAKQDSSAMAGLILEMSAYLLMTIRKTGSFQQVLIKHVLTAELIFAADTTSFRTSSTHLQIATRASSLSRTRAVRRLIPARVTTAPNLLYE
jgi:hypothetical protein